MQQIWNTLGQEGISLLLPKKARVNERHAIQQEVYGENQVLEQQQQKKVTQTMLELAEQQKQLEFGIQQNPELAEDYQSKLEELQAFKSEISEILLQDTIVQKVYTKEKVSGYTKLVIERVHVDYSNAVAKLSEINPERGERIEYEAHTRHAAFLQTPEGQARVKELEQQGHMNTAEAEEILKQQFEIESLQYHLTQDPEISTYIREHAAELPEIAAFLQTYQQWQDGRLELSIQQGQAT
ncbi:MAG: hypothetical protein H6765_00160 [Candidatus Peribacteria bacterium]|nr:MAG: hypothetical protein H6765_00160 [Candidatus Peribacteria bacterium]